MPTIGVTGAHGLIGKRICEKLNAIPIPREWFEMVGPNLKFDTIIHCSAYGNHSQQTDEHEMFIANVLKTYYLLESAKISGVKNFIYIGTSSEYGKKTRPMNEEMTLDTDTMYGCTKVCGTFLTKRYSQFMNTVTVRPFSVYGEEEADWRFIPTIIRSLNNDIPLNLLNGYHDWIYIDDFVRGVQKVLENIDLLNGQTINIGTGRSFENMEIVSLLESISGKICNLVVHPKKEQDSSVWQADNRKLKALGWKQKVSMYEGLKRVYEYKT